MIKYDGVSPQSSTGYKRNQFSCRQCRKDKRRCSPADRDWENKHEKCKRCSDLGHECSPPEKASGTFVKKRSMINIRSKSPGSTSLFEDATLTTDQPGTPISTRSILTKPDHDATDVESLSASKNMISNGIWQDRRKGQCMNLSDRARRMIIRLLDLNATREMLRKAALGPCDSIEVWLGRPVTERVAINAYIVAIQREFKVEVQKTMRLIMDGLEHDTEAIVTSLLLIIYRFEHPLNSSGSTNVCLDDQILSQLSLISSQTRTLVSDADLVCASGLGMSHRHNFTGAAIKPYIKASQIVSEILHNVILEDMDQRNILPRQERIGFPPSHIAYLHGNQDAAFALWKSHEKDMLGRTLLHHVVYGSDIQMLHRLLEHDREAVTSTTADIFGFTPLAVTACCRNEDQIGCFSVLWQSGADRSTLEFTGRSVLALAVRSGSIEIVSSILQDGNIFGLTQRDPWESHELLEAVRTNTDTTIVRMLLNYYTKYPSCVNAGVLAEAMRIARERCSAELVDALRPWFAEFMFCDDLYPHCSMDLDASESWTMLDNADSPTLLSPSEDSWHCGRQAGLEFARPYPPFTDFGDILSRYAL